ncbi:MAG: CapA family protein, partial [Anaerolineaceae bacterium]|nr:CapA family protein [Anaerolineaceae bacterium]
KIAELKAEGYVVITTFQAWEIDRLMYDEVYRKIFKDAANAGADIIQGSQAHAPMGFEFVNDSLIHYGLGNFLFDQMEPSNIREFYDRHIIYNGKYINTELLTATLMDWSRPVPMIEQDRQSLLDEIFTASKMRKE